MKKLFTLLFVLSGLFANAQVPVKISALPTASLTTFDSIMVPMVESGATKKMRGYQLRTSLGVIDSLRSAGGFVQARKNGSWISQYALTVPTLDDVVLSGDSTGSELNIRGARLWYSGAPAYQTIFGWGANNGNAGTSITAMGYAAGYNQNGAGNSFYGVSSGASNSGDFVSFYGVNAGINNTYDNVSAFGSGAVADSSNQVVLADGIRDLRLDLGALSADRKLRIPNKSGTIALLDDITGGTPNFPTINDTLPDTRSLYCGIYPIVFDHASGNSFTLNNTGFNYNIPGVADITVNSSGIELKSFGGTISEYGMVKTTGNTASLRTTNGTKTSWVTAYPTYSEMNGADSVVIKGIEETTVDEDNQRIVVETPSGKLQSVPWQTINFDTTVFKVVGDTVKLKYREYVASLTQSGTNAPVATVLFNNLGDSVLWDYASTGQYTAKYYNGGSPQNITGSKVVVSMTNNVFYSPSLTVPVYIEAIHSNTVKVFTRKMDDATPLDELLGELNAGYTAETNIITIRIYD